MLHRHMLRVLQKTQPNARQIYNAEETSFWCSVPKSTLAGSDEHSVSGGKEAKESVTVLMCANAAGIHKCKLLVIGKSVHPHPLKVLKYCLWSMKATNRHGSQGKLPQTDLKSTLCWKYKIITHLWGCLRTEKIAPSWITALHILMLMS